MITLAKRVRCQLTSLSPISPVVMPVYKPSYAARPACEPTLPSPFTLSAYPNGVFHGDHPFLLN